MDPDQQPFKPRKYESRSKKIRISNPANPEYQMKTDPNGSGPATLQTQKVNESGSKQIRISNHENPENQIKRIQVNQDQRPCKARKSNESGSK
jgi:hypothetical protein